MEVCGNRDLCINLFRKLQILPSISQYILPLLMSAVPDQNLHSTHIETHNIGTKKR
jgi:hypothetical protein